MTQLQLPLDAAMDTVSCACKHCGETITGEPLIVTKHFGTRSEQFYFCSEYCHQSHYLNRLREGM